MSHIYTDTTPDRCPDVNFDKGEKVPSGHELIEGKQLMLTARSAKVPYGIATKRTYRPGTTDSRMETVGIIILAMDRKRFLAALENKNANKKKP